MPPASFDTTQSFGFSDAMPRSGRWLIPRLDSFHAARPEAEVVVTTTTTLHNALHGGFDIAVRREPRVGTGANHPWDAYRAVPFLQEANTVVASPSLLAAPSMRAPHDLEGATLLTSETRPGDWSDWLGTAGLPPGYGQPPEVQPLFRRAAGDGGRARLRSRAPTRGSDAADGMR